MTHCSKAPRHSASLSPIRQAAHSWERSRLRVSPSPTTILQRCCQRVPYRIFPTLPPFPLASMEPGLHISLYPPRREQSHWNGRKMLCPGNSLRGKSMWSEKFDSQTTLAGGRNSIVRNSNRAYASFQSVDGNPLYIRDAEFE